ncbi:Tubulin, C-terminal [Phytophthora cactorum]|nr:Tubulin, C-terminal [Phytophthora cactorum]
MKCSFFLVRSHWSVLAALGVQASGYQDGPADASPMQVANAAFEEGVDWDISLATDQGRAFNRSVGSVLILRGKNSIQADSTTFSDPRLYSPWNADPFRCYSSSSNFSAYDKTGTLISNSKAMLQTLAITMDKAYDMFSHGAYLHQYERFGIDRDFFQDAFLRIDQITQNYSAL